MKKVFFSFLLSILFLQVNAQSSFENIKKYWHYRYRLVNNFMVVGEGRGKSLPATIRNEWNGGILYWGETPKYLGWYIGVLATEYRLLKNNNQSTDRTLYELYCALLAVDRLDKNAEELAWGLPVSNNNLNGCLIQDDIPPDFISLYYNQLNNNVPTNPITLNTGIPGMVNELSSTITDDHDYRRVMSQDMIADFLVGMALVKKCVENTSLAFINGNQSYNVNLRQMAINATDRIMMRLQAFEWKIYKPDGTAVPNGSGGDCQGFSFGFAKAGGYINYPAAYLPIPEMYSVWKSGQNTRASYTCPQYRNARICLELASIGNSWEINNQNTTADGIKFQGDYDAGSVPICGSYPANHNGFDLFYGMLHRYLYNYDLQENPIVDLCKVRDILNSAPFDGPFYHDDTCPEVGGTITSKAPAGWRSTLRFSVEVPTLNTGQCGFRGNYNGLDYMLMHNLYFLTSTLPTAAPYYIPQPIPNFVSDTYPYCCVGPQNEWAGTISDHSEIHVPAAPIIVNQLTVKTSPYIGSLEIYGGPYGILLTNTKVEEYGLLKVLCTDYPASCFPGISYEFDPTAYNRIINPGNELPAYTMTDEFRQVMGNTISCNPNPAKDLSEINISLVKNTSVTISVYNLIGELVNTLVSNENYSSGSYKINANLSALPAGVYYLTLQTAEEKVMSKIIKQ